MADQSARLHAGRRLAFHWQSLSMVEFYPHGKHSGVVLFGAIFRDEKFGKLKPWGGIKDKS
jgi:hypothetical protein